VLVVVALVELQAPEQAGLVALVETHKLKYGCSGKL